MRSGVSHALHFKQRLLRAEGASRAAEPGSGLRVWHRALIWCHRLCPQRHLSAAPQLRSHVEPPDVSALLLWLPIVRLAACRVVRRLAGPAVAAVRNCPERCKDRRGFKEGEGASLEDRGAQAGRGQGGCDPGAREGEGLREWSRQSPHGHPSPRKRRSRLTISLLL